MLWKVFGWAADLNLFPVIQGFNFLLKLIHSRPILSCLVFCLDVSNSFQDIENCLICFFSCKGLNYLAFVLLHLRP